MNADDLMYTALDQVKWHRGHTRAVQQRIGQFNGTDWGAEYCRQASKRYLVSEEETLARRMPCGARFDEVRNSRCSTREFASVPMTRQVLANLLQTSFATERRHALGPAMPYPAAGGLYATEHYVVALNVGAEPPWIAHYRPRDRVLSRLRELDTVEPFLDALNWIDTEGRHPARRAGVAIVQTVIPERTMHKYLNRGFLFALLECGMATQMLHMSAAALGLGSVLQGGYFDNEMAALLAVDGVRESITGVSVIGYTGD